MIKDAYDAAPKPKKDNKGGGKKKPKGPSTPKPLTIPPIPQGHLTAPSTPTAQSSTLLQQTASNKENTHPNIVQIEILEPIAESSSTDFTKKGTILDLANSLASGGIVRKDDASYTPRNVWKDQPSTQDLKRAKEEKRARFGFEVDFENYEKPLEESITRVTRAVREQKVN